ncbi:prolyl oligopeptidase family serine peptidase [Actinoallomurus liliacearum]|uniref:prolyl oligopeptidase n=1 Tax=Actinoallomurus liliacearum TaxID=1080073 RepID=A0ABP8THH9_9ACTN
MEAATARARRRYPEAPREGVVQELHGQRVPDPYRWLEDPADPRTARWSAEQDTLYQAERETWPGLDRWTAEVAARTATDRVLTPKVRGGRTFWLRQRADRDHPALFVADGEAGERMLLDPCVLDPTGRTVLDAWEPSVEGDLLAYQISRDGTEDSLLWVLDVATGSVVDGPIDRVRRSSIGWLPGGAMFYYVRYLGTRFGEERYHRRVCLHRVGAAPDEDVVVFGDGWDKTRFYSVAVTADGRWLTVTATTGTGRATDVHLADLSAGPPERPRLRPVQEGTRARTRLHIASGTGPYDTVWLRTDHGAAHGRVVACRPADLDRGPDGWREVIAERADAVLTDLAVLTGPELAHPIGLVTWVRHAAAEVTVHDLTDGRRMDTIALPGTGSVGLFSVRPDGGHEAWFTYTDFATPPYVLRYDGRTGRVTPWAPGGSAPGPGVEGVASRQVAFQSRDGTTVRMFVISAAGRPDTPRPTLLTGYGGFAASMSPRYTPRVLAWVRAGGVFAWACLRGGGEEGEPWHRAGSREHKQNTFDDFAAAADHLVATGWSRPGRLAVMGGSNGGLLVGAALTQRPDKYAAVVCMSPLLDMVRYELSGLGPSWVPEYGSASDPAQLRTLLGYSPYHRVTSGTAYPPVLFTVADGDTRTDPLHARKMCAALQHASSGGPVLLRLERGVGHGDRATSRTVALHGETLAFLAAHVGLDAPGHVNSAALGQEGREAPGEVGRAALDHPAAS